MQVYLLENTVYHCTWKAYVVLCRALGVHPRSFSGSPVLAFLQWGVDQKLALSTKGQVSALLSFFQCSLVMHSLNHAFIHGVCHMVPTMHSLLPPWDLNLALSAPQKPCFVSIQDIPLLTFSQKVAFLVAITSVQ